ncbi:hypothetical protein G6K86_30475 [Agrobacterium rhizogenes]|nr:hypothetical protein [Rhizobium rhizogenes]
MKFSGSVSLRPVRIGFLVSPDDIEQVSRAARLSACMWGGRYNPIIPVFESGGERWSLLHRPESGLDIARGFVEFFEPDVLVEFMPGMADTLGWELGDRFLGLPRVLSIDELYRTTSRGSVEWPAGIDILEVMSSLFDSSFQYERRQKIPFANISHVPGDAYFDVVCGRYPLDEPLQYIKRSYEQVFSPEELPASAETALKQLEAIYAGPLGITGYDLKESFPKGFRDHSFYIFDPTDAGDALDYWNFRLVEKRVRPINANWFGECAPFMREQILAVHRPIPNNPFGTKFKTTLHFASSISEHRIAELLNGHLSGLPEDACVIAHDPCLWQPIQRGHDRRESKILVSAGKAPFDIDVSSERSVKVPALSPKFLNSTERHSKAYWVNVIQPSNLRGQNTAATIYPTNLLAPGYPRVALGERLRIGREGWVIQNEYELGHTLLEIQTGRDAIVGWLKTREVDATPSEEGQIATQVIAAAGGLFPSAMFGDRETLKLLGEMAESHTHVSRHGQRVGKSSPDRAKHIQTVRQHFEKRTKRSFGYWNALDYFLKRSVFRAGLRVQCPICSYQNWLDLNALSYRPTCTRCLNEFEFSQSPEHLKEVEWYYRVVGPFAAPDYARGGYAVALTLRCLSESNDTEMTWSTGLSLKQLNCEVDFIAWHRASSMLDEERDEPLLVIGEAKSFGHGAINDDSVTALKKVAEKFPGSVMVVSILRDGGELTLAEVARLRSLALWGRRSSDKSSNSLVVLTGTELFAQHGIYAAWKKEDGHERFRGHDFHDLLSLATLTQERYLGLVHQWFDQTAKQGLTPVQSIVRQLAARAEGASSK